MASFFTRALDKLTPWRRGGEVQRDLQARKKKKDEEEARYRASAPTSRSNQQTSQSFDEPLRANQPVNIFEDLNKNLTLGQNKPGVIPVFKNSSVQPVQAPQPGTVVKPTVVKPRTAEDDVNDGLNAGKSWERISRETSVPIESVRKYSEATRPSYGIKLEKPKQSLGNRFRDVFDANTESDKYRRQEGNNNTKLQPGQTAKPIVLKNPGNIVSRTPIVGHITKTLNTLGTQGAELIPTVGQQFATREYSAATEEYTKAVKSGDKNRIAQAKERLSGAVNRVDSYNREQDAAHTMFEKNKGGLFNAGTLYDEAGSQRGDIKTGVTDIALPTAVSMLDLYTLGQGAAITEGLKQGGKVGLRTAAPHIVKAGVGNYASGDLSARSEGASNSQAVKSGILNSVFGLIPDVGLPLLGRSFKNKVLPSILRGRGVDPKVAVEELDDAAISASAEAANQALKPRPISITKDIPVETVEGLPQPVRVRNLNEPAPLIREFPGDASAATPDALVKQLTDDARAEAARNAAFDQAKTAPAPNPAIEGVIPRTNPVYNLDEAAVKSAQDDAIDQYAAMLRDVGEGNGTQLVPDGQGGYTRTSNNFRTADTAGKKMSKAAWREEAERQLREGSAEPGLQKAFNDAADPEVQSMLNRGDVTDVPEGRPITVKQVESIPVRDETVVPTGLPETPGTVRTTTQTSPMEVKTEAAANAPVTARPAQLPAETQAILDNPKQYNKRQVAAARNQRKLARQLAKTQEDTVAAMERIEGTKASTTAQPEGYAPTGEFARGKRGNAYQKTSAEAETVAGQQEMATRSVDDLLDEIGGKESFTPGDRRRIAAALENVAKSNPDDRETRLILKKLQSKSRTELAQGLAMWPRIVRRSASADTLTNRWESKIARALEDPRKMTDADWGRVQKANDTFTLARDRAAQLEEQFKRSGSESDFKAWEDAHKAARQADTDAKFIEADVARRVLKGEKGAAVNKVLDDLKKEADVNTMDAVTASMLSGTATGFRNTFGTELAGVENRLFANTRAKITNKLFGENVGGFDRKSARLGRKVGIVKLGKDAARRAEIGGKNPIEWAKNWSTTINSGGESSLQSQVYSRLGKYYKNQFAEQGLSGKELDMRMRHALLTDPDGMGNTFLDASMKSSGLTGIFQKGQTIEKAVTDYVGRQTDNKTAQAASKLIMRIAVGFPTATTNFIVQSGKRLAVGLPSFLESGVKIASGDKAGAALAFDRALKEAGSGTAILGLGVALGSQDMISGPYPSDKEERARWEREGISENSIKIGGNWYPIPQGAGMLGLPLMVGAAIGREGDSNESLKELLSPKNLAELLPTDQLQGFLNMASGNGAPQDLKNTIASGIRAGTPAGSLLNQISKSFDDTKNDTTTKDFWHNVLDQVMGGIPGVNNMANIPNKEDDAGNVIQNPNALPLAFGASSATQGAGEQRSEEIASKVNSTVQSLDDIGVLNDPNLKEVLDTDTRAIYNKLTSGKKVSEADVKKLQEGFVKGVSSEGTDTAYLEREQYDTNLAALKLKRELMKNDKTVRPSSIKDIDTAIKRGEVYKTHKLPYELISDYQHVGVEDWRKMGDPEDDEYDPDMYQKLWDVDQLMTKAGVSYKKGALDKGKYYQKEKKGSRGGAGSRGGSGSFSSDFGQLKAGDFAPSVRAYETIDQQTGSVPIIRTVRPNIVHKIGSSG